MKSPICDTNGHLINVITMLIAHWEADERACKRDKIKREKSSSNFSDISGSKLWCSSCSTPATVTAGIHGSVASGPDPTRVLDGKGEQRVLSKKSQIWEWTRDILLLVTLVAAAQSCLDKAEGDGEELSDSNDRRKCLRRETQSPLLAWSLASVRFTRFCGVQLSLCFVI